MRKIDTAFLLASVTLFLASCQSPNAAEPSAVESPLKSGDLVFQDSSPVSNQAVALRVLTDSQWTHCGIYFEGANGGIVVEAVGRSRKFSSWEDWRQRGKDQVVGIRRLNRELTAAETAKLKKAALSYAGKTYDLKFAWDDRAIYCSELIWKAYRDALGIELGKLNRMGDFDLDDPLARQLIERPGSWGSLEAVPLDEIVSTPVAIFESEQLRGL